jgi:hypothetical protein
VRGVILLALAGCSGEEPDDTGPGTTVETVTDYDVLYDWSPAGDPAAGDTVEFTARIVDQDGRAIPDLQQNHERMVHTLFVSEDLETFLHVHHEDFYEITADDLRDSTFHFPLTLPEAGGYRIVFDFAHHNAWLTRQGWIDVVGEPAMKPAPEPDFATEVAVGDLVVSVAWVAEPVVGFTSQWTVHVTDATGAEVTDLVQWLGADAHAALISADLAFTSHTHAYQPGMENMAPGMEMPHVYTGPDVTFQAVFTQPGLHRMFVQLAREGAPDDPYTVPFWFEVLP